MATYVISDLHGEIEKLHKLYEEIHFTQEDAMYILGDVIDRGPSGVDILKEIMETKNIHLILGNHEYMCMRYFADDVTEKEIARWNRNGNETTLAGFEGICPEEKSRILQYIASLPDHFILSINGNNYYLVHGFVGENTHDKVWNRPKLDDFPDIEKIPELQEHPELRQNMTLIIGHTPVLLYFAPDSIEEQNKYDEEFAAKGGHYEILHAKGFIDVDCCCGYGLKACRLGCIRLEDGEEFYVDVS